MDEPVNRSYQSVYLQILLHIPNDLSKKEIELLNKKKNKK
jgi:hypothetical protein